MLTVWCVVRFTLYCADVEIQEDKHMQSPITMAFYRDEMVNHYARRNSQLDNPQQLSGTNMSHHQR